MKKKILLGLVLVLCCLTGCGSNSGNSKNSNDNSPPEIKMSDIDWSVKKGIIQDERHIAFSYKNNTGYTIADMKIEFKRKDSVSDDKMLNLFKYYKDNKYMSESEIKKTGLISENHRFIKAGKKSNLTPVQTNDSTWDLQNMDQYEVMEPDKATITVIKNNKAYIFYYDFINKEMTMDDENSGKKIYNWSTSKMAKKLPKPSFESVIIGSDDSDYFTFDAFNVTWDQYEKYIEKVKKTFTKIETDEDNLFEASDTKGNSISLSYESFDKSLNCTVEGTDEETTESTTEATATTTVEKVTTTAKKKSTQTSGIRPRIKKAIDSYETVMNSYCKFMKKYNESSDTSSMMKDYADYMEKYSDAAEKFEKIKDDNLNDDELAYYTKVQVRVTKKLADVQ